MSIEAPTAQCPNCGARAVDDAIACATCGASLLVDVFLAQSVTDAKRAFQAAKDLGAMGRPAPSFQEARGRLSLGSVALVSLVSRPFAAEVIATLKLSGVEAVTRPTAAVARAVLPIRALAGLGVLLVLAGVSVLLRAKPVEPPALVAVVASPIPVMASNAAPTAALTTQQISKKVTRSVANLRCEDRIGSGFFIGVEKLITNAHVLCAGSEPIAVTLPDGRNLLGKVLVKDPWTDLAVVEVLGANATPLDVGDTTSLEPGDKLVFVGSPKGHEFTLHEGTVSFVGRNFLGLAYVQLNASINPGNSGGPLFNDRGQVLGIVSMKVADTDGIGLALPLEYAVAPANEEALARWRKILERVAGEDRKEQAEEMGRLMPGTTQVVGSRVVEGRAVAVLMERWRSAPHGVIRDFTFAPRSGGSCAVRGDFGNWVSLKAAEAGQSESRRISWMLRNGLADNVFLSAGLIESIDCTPAQLAGDGQLELKEGGEERGHFNLEGASLKKPEVRAPPPAPLPQERTYDTRPPDEEATWRSRFRRARTRLAQVEESAKAAKQEIEKIDRAVANGTYPLSQEGRSAYFQLQERVARAEPERVAAEADLHELERQAANNAIPLEWRR